LAISNEETDGRIYADFAARLKDNYPATAQVFKDMEAEEDTHRLRLIDEFQRRFGDHVPLISHQDVKGFITRKPVWLIQSLGFRAATALAMFLVAIELLVISWIRKRYMDTPFLRAAFQVIVGGVCVFVVGILIGRS